MISCAYNKFYWQSKPILSLALPKHLNDATSGVRVGERKEFITALYNLNNSSESWEESFLGDETKLWNSSCTKLRIASYFDKSCNILSLCSKLLKRTASKNLSGLAVTMYYLLEITPKKPVNYSHWSWNVLLVSEKQIQTISKCKGTVYLLSLKDRSATNSTPSISNMKLTLYLQTHL